MIAFEIPLYLRLLLSLLVVAGIAGGVTLAPSARTTDHDHAGAPAGAAADAEHTDEARTRASGSGVGRQRPAPSPRAIAATGPDVEDPVETDLVEDGDDAARDDDPEFHGTGGPQTADTAGAQHATDDAAPTERSRPRAGTPVGPDGEADDTGIVLGELDDQELPPGAPSAVADLAASAKGPVIGAGDGFAATPGPSGATAIPTGPLVLKAGPGCSVSCITSGTAHSLGTRATLVAATNTPATIWLFVWDDQGLFLSANTDSLVAGFGAPFADLQPGTTYQAAVIAIDAEGYQDSRYGEFTTLRRFVEFSFDEITVTDHPFPKIFAHYQVGGAWQADASRGADRRADPTIVYAPPPMVFDDLGDGTSVVVQVVATGGEGDTWTTAVGTQHNFDDCGTGFGPYDPAWDQKNSCQAYANATNYDIHLAGVPNTAQAANPHAILGIPLIGDGGGVRFQTFVSLKIWYG